MYKVPLSALAEREGAAVKKSPRAKKKSSPSVSTRKEVVVAVADLELSDEGVKQDESSKVAVEKSSDEKIGKKKRRKKVTEKPEGMYMYIYHVINVSPTHTVFPDVVQKLLKICCDPVDNVELLTEQLHSLHLHPLPDHSHTMSHKETLHVSTTEEDTIVSQDLEASNPSPLDMLNSLWGGMTLLHLAAATGNVAIVSSLLLYGADPVVKDQSGKTSYLVSKDRPVRDSFRRFMASHPSAYDYDSAHIPSPLTQDMEKERREKTNEKKKTQKKARKQREKASIII